MKKLIDKLHQEQMLSAEEFRTLLTDRSEETDLYARELADQVRQQVYGNQIYVRGLIEFTNYCKNRLLLLWNPPEQPKCPALPPDRRRYPCLLQRRL